MSAATFLSVSFTPGPAISVRTRRTDERMDPRRSPVVVHIEIGDLRLMLDDDEAEQLRDAISAALTPDAAVP